MSVRCSEVPNNCATHFILERLWTRKFQGSKPNTTLSTIWLITEHRKYGGLKSPIPLFWDTEVITNPTQNILKHYILSGHCREQDAAQK